MASPAKYASLLRQTLQQNSKPKASRFLTNNQGLRPLSGANMKIALTEEQVAKILVEFFDREHNIKIETTAFSKSYSYSSDFCTLLTEKTNEL